MAGSPGSPLARQPRGMEEFPYREHVLRVLCVLGNVEMQLDVSTRQLTHGLRPREEIRESKAA